MLKTYLICIIAIGFSVLKTNAQLANNIEFDKERLRINKTGMIALSSWAGANIVTGSIGWSATQGKLKYFHQMNVFWNIVNLGIAVPGLLKTKNKQNISNGELIQKQYATEQLFLINDVLNILYIGSGFILKSIADNYPDNRTRFRGYGNALLLQGGFLLVFDMVQYLRHRNHRKKSNNIFFGQLSLSNNGIGLKYTLK